MQVLCPYRDVLPKQEVPFSLCCVVDVVVFGFLLFVFNSLTRLTLTSTIYMCR